MTDDELKKAVTEIRDAAETALDFWSNPDVRAAQIAEVLEAARSIELVRRE